MRSASVVDTNGFTNSGYFMMAPAYEMSAQRIDPHANVMSAKRALRCRTEARAGKEQCNDAGNRIVALWRDNQPSESYTLFSNA